MEEKARLISAVIFGIVGCSLAWYWFGWQLVLVLFILFWGNNLLTVE